MHTFNFIARYMQHTLKAFLFFSFNPMIGWQLFICNCCKSFFSLSLSTIYLFIYESFSSTEFRMTNN